MQNINHIPKYVIIKMSTFFFPISTGYRVKVIENLFFFRRSVIILVLLAKSNCSRFIMSCFLKLSLVSFF